MNWICTLKLARDKYKNLLDDCKLQTVCNYLFGNKIQTHRAEDDVRMAMKLYNFLICNPNQNIFKTINDKNILCFDVETTGTNSKKHLIVEVCFCIFNKNRIKFNYTKCINIHKIYIPPIDIKTGKPINNITQEDIDNGDELIDVLYIFMRKIKEYKVENIIAHNLSFDKNMLINNIKREYEKDKKNNKIINIIKVLGFHDIINNNNIQRTINFGVK